jgi:hypothetical protein
MYHKHREWVWPNVGLVFIAIAIFLAASLWLKKPEQKANPATSPTTQPTTDEYPDRGYKYKELHRY